MKIGEKLFHVVVYIDDDDDGCGTWIYDVTLEEAIEFVGDSNNCCIETTRKRETVYEDGEWVMSSEDAKDLATKEWEEYILANPDSPEALFGVGY